ncbi:metal ABC transporter solute-binding protein, Zn/Mn family [Paenibacillus sinopodophylli]|uniref:metal ABC transporter solute-binding protein, Zn/Mn family n=1 Tax=Paenibacillus sinopodophylli TaxID=1837342 RepID=UPI00110CAC91|nr:zinc ABC transporter substrate-binding protein [Paenibacillus sinopodophylli]
MKPRNWKSKLAAPLLTLLTGAVIMSGCSTTASEENTGNEHNHNGATTHSIVASTSWSALIARTAGLDNITILAPVDMKHPNEYDFKPSDIEKVNNADMVVYSEYEPFMKKILESAEVPETDRFAVVTENTPEALNTQISNLAEQMGTTDIASKALEEIDSKFEAVLAETAKLDVAAKRVVAQAYMVPVAKAMGYEVVGEFGPAEVTPTQAAELAALKPALVIDNLHFPQGAEIAKLADSKLVEIRNYPETETQTLTELIGQNAGKLGLTLGQ